MKNLYDQWADVYDDVYAYLTEDKDFYLQWAKTSVGPVLELGCGTGRITIPVALNGVDIVGIDISPKMIEVAKSKLKGTKFTSKIDFLIPIKTNIFVNNYSFSRVSFITVCDRSD